MRVLALDVGEKRVGLALSDELGWTAQGIGKINRKSKAEDFDLLLALCSERGVSLLLCGLPRNMDGSEGFQAKRVRTYAELAAEHCSLPLLFLDERLTTRMATSALLEGDVRRGKRKEKVDELSAVILLQGFLDGGGLKKWKEQNDHGT